MTDNVTPTQAQADTLHDAFTRALLRHRGCDLPTDDNWSAVQFGEIAANDVRAMLDAVPSVASQAAEIARLREIVDRVPISSMVGKLGWKSYADAERGLLAALSAQPDDQPAPEDDNDHPEVLANCETCRAIIRDGDVFVMDDYCVCLCRKCMADDQGVGK